MATGILAILDDIAILMDDVAVMSKLAAKKTAGILGDDLAVNAEKATGVASSREIPVIWAITKGSMVNKLIILPCAFLLSAYIPWLILPILMCGACYLAYEGAEKVLEWISHGLKAAGGHKSDIHVSSKEKAIDDTTKPTESEKIKSAIRTDFILSIEIIILALETVLEASFVTQLLVVSFISLIATVGVYGIVALLVQMDDLGFYLIKSVNASLSSRANLTRQFGRFLVNLLPKVIYLLGIVGTVAMLLVGGGIFVHNLGWLHHLLDSFPALLADFLVGFLVGVFIVMVEHFISTRISRSGRQSSELK